MLGQCRLCVALARRVARCSHQRCAPRCGGAAQAGDLVTDFLVLAIAANVAAFLLEVPMTTSTAPTRSGRSCRSAPRWPGVSAAWSPARRAAREGRRGVAPAPAPAPRPRPAGALLPVLAAVLACYAVMLGVAAAHRQAAAAQRHLTGWLRGTT